MLHSALNQLEPELQEVIRMRYFEHRSLQEISELLSQNYNRVRGRYQQALELLRQQMEGYSL